MHPITPEAFNYSSMILNLQKRIYTTVPILSTRNVRAGELAMEEVKYVSPTTYDELTRLFKPQMNDVLLTKGGTTGLAKIVDFDWPFCVWVHLAVLRPNKDVHPSYLESALNSKYCYLQSQKYTHGITNRDLGLTRIRNIELLLPRKGLQEKFAKTKLKIRSIQDTMKNSILLLDNQFNSLVQRAFRGEL